MANVSYPRPTVSPTNNTQPPQPREQRIARSRSGCETCKLRKIKCDENRPVCNRCKLRNRPCRYSPPKTWLFEPDSSPSAEESETAVVPAQKQPYQRPFQTPEAVQPELSLLSLLRHDDSRRLASFQYFSTFIIAPTDADPKFYPIWSKETCAQLRLEEPAVDYLIGALATVHRAVVDPDGPNESTYYYACVHKAVTRMKNHWCEFSDEAFVICNIMVGMCELMRTGDTAANAKQIEKSFFFLADWQKDWEDHVETGLTARQRRRKDIVDELSPYIFMAADHYHLLGKILAQKDVAPTDQALTTHTRWYDFRTLEEANNAIEDICTRRPTYFDLSHTGSFIRTQNWAIVEVVLRFWEQSWNELKAKMSETHITRQETLHIEAIEASYSFLCLNRPPNATDFNVDSVTVDIQRHENIVKRYEIIHAAGGLMHANAAGFEFPVTMLGPIFFVACRCRHPGIRRRALAILDEMSIIEEAWNSTVASSIATALQDVWYEAWVETNSKLRRRPNMHEIPVIWPWRVDCAYNDRANKTAATLTIKYGLKAGDELPIKWDVVIIMLDEVSEVAACQKCRWPMDAVIKSSGVFSNNVVTTPYVPGNKIAVDRIWRTQLAPRRRWLS